MKDFIMTPRCILILLLLSFGLRSVAQKSIFEWTVPATVMLNTEFLISGDSIFVRYDEKNFSQGTVFNKAMWIDASGKSTRAHVNEVGDENICAIANYNNKYYYYYFSGKKNSLQLEALNIDVNNAYKREVIDVIHSFEGTFLGHFTSNNLFLLTYDEDTQQLILTEVEKDSILKVKKFTMPVNLKNVAKSVRVLTDTHVPFSNMSGGAAKFKIFVTGDNLFLTVDALSSTNATSAVPKSQPVNASHTKSAASRAITTVINVNVKTEQVSHVVIPHSSSNSFSSYVLDRYIYRLTTGKKMTFEVLDIQTGALIDMKELHGNDFKDKRAHHRTGSKHFAHRNNVFGRVIRQSWMANPMIFVMPDQNSQNKVNIIIGTYIEENSPGIISNANPLVSLIGSLVWTSLRMASEGPGFSNYTYFSYDLSTKELTFMPNDILLRKIDEHETPTRPRKYGYKGYIFKDGIISLYFEPKTRRASVVRFE